MTESEIAHETLVFEHSYNVPPARLFAAWADPQIRACWSAPSPDSVVLFEAYDFSSGGIEISRCGHRQYPRCRVEVHYADIVAEKRIVFTETVEENGRVLGLSLVTITLRPTGNATLLTLVCQVTSLRGEEFMEASRHGYQAALHNLAMEFHE